MNKLKNVNFIYLICLIKILFFVGCKKQKINYVQKLNIQKNINVTENLYKLKIEGIECKICANAAVHALEHINDIQKVEFVCTKQNFEDCYANIYLKSQHTLDFDKLKNELKNEGFVLQSATGQFIGKFSDKNKNIIFEIQDSQIKAKIKYNVDKLIKYNELTIIKGKLVNIGNDDYILYLNNLG